jgi:CHRD domain
MLRVTRVTAALLAAIAAVGLGMTTVATADDDNHGRRRQLRARLAAHNEVPIVISDARGRFTGKINDAPMGPELEWELSYEGLEGTISQAHIHVGQPFASGGIMLWFCGSATNPGPPDTPTCPAPPATIRGTFTAANVIGPIGQAVPAGSFEDALEAILGGNAYVNVHSSSAPTGEIRGQIR